MPMMPKTRNTILNECAQISSFLAKRFPVSGNTLPRQVAKKKTKKGLNAIIRDVTPTLMYAPLILF
jgi:hypothetical protein